MAQSTVLQGEPQLRRDRLNVADLDCQPNVDWVWSAMYLAGSLF
jgi:hypothetical protein